LLGCFQREHRTDETEAGLQIGDRLRGGRVEFLALQCLGKGEGLHAI